MKSFKNILIIVTFLNIYSIHAKQTGTRTIPTTMPSIPTKQPISTVPPKTTPITQQAAIVQPKQPLIQPTTYAQALNAIRQQTLPFRIITNNTFTSEFINFVKSLNLSDIEINALLEAGAYLHTPWTGNNQRDNEIITLLKNNISTTMSSLSKSTEGKQKLDFQPIETMKPIPSSRPEQIKSVEVQKPVIQKPTEETIQTPYQCTMNDLIMILDPGKIETIETGMGALTEDTIVALQEKAAPIIMSSNILAIILNVKAKLGDNNMQQLRTIIQTSTDTKPIVSFLYKLNVSNRFGQIALISLIDFDNKNFNCYLHKSESLVLIIPKQYMQANFPNAANLSLNDQAQACGFNPANLISINDFTANDLLQKLQAQPSSEKFISNLTALFIPNKEEEDIKWAINLTGHGGLAKSTQWVRDLLAELKKELASQQELPARFRSDTSSIESKIKRYENMLSTSNDTQTISASSYVAGITLREFSELMEFFNKKINTAFLFYTTCFSGGYNQIFVNEILSSLNVNFIVASQGVDERTTLTDFPKLIPNSSKSGLIVSKQPYTDFFKLLNLFICKPEEFVKIKGEKQEPVSQILRTIIPTINKDDQPFVRFPGIGVFEALSLDKNIKVLTQAIVKAHEIEKRPIDLSATDLNVIMVRPSRINVLLNLGNKGAGHPIIVLPTPKNIPSSYETFHVFKEINFENTLQSLLFNFISLNARTHTQTVLVKNLTGITYEKSGLSKNQGTTNVIHNLIIQIKGILGTALKESFSTSTPLTPQDIQVSQMGANIDIAFELNGNIYQCIVGIKDFNAPNLLNNFTKITFTSNPMATMDMNPVVNKFLLPQEISKLKTPITLESIAQYIDSEIDQQEPSIFNQPDADNDALRKFLERSPK